MLARAQAADGGAKRDCWEKIWKVSEWQAKALGHFCSSLQGNTEVILFLRETDVCFLKVRSDEDIRRIRVTVCAEETEGGTDIHVTLDFVVSI